MFLERNIQKDQLLSNAIGYFLYYKNEISTKIPSAFSVLKASEDLYLHIDMSYFKN